MFYIPPNKAHLILCKSLSPPKSNRSFEYSHVRELRLIQKHQSRSLPRETKFGKIPPSLQPQMDRLRRKSCCCSDCGTYSSFQYKNMNDALRNIQKRVPEPKKTNLLLKHSSEMISRKCSIVLEKKKQSRFVERLLKSNLPKIEEAKKEPRQCSRSFKLFELLIQSRSFDALKSPKPSPAPLMPQMSPTQKKILSPYYFNRKIDPEKRFKTEITSPQNFKSKLSVSQNTTKHSLKSVFFLATPKQRKPIILKRLIYDQKSKN